MNCFLEIAKKSMSNLSSYNTIKVVIGNESCDLDSAVSAIVYGLLLHNEMNKESTRKEIVIPVLNIEKKDFPVKTEVTYFFTKKNIDFANFIFRDDIDLKYWQSKNTLQLYLVDHHTLPGKENLVQCVKEIFDHRPRDSEWPWAKARVIVELVGSCCTLITREILQRKPDLLIPLVAELLYGTILLDTANLLPSAGRAKPLDHEMAAELKKKCVINFDNHSLYQDNLFHELLKARTDISKLTSLQLLSRDLKIFTNIPVPGLPISIRNYIIRPDANEALKQFCLDKSTGIVILLSLEITGELIQREVGVFSVSKSVQALQGNKIAEFLKKSTDPNLELNEIENNMEGLILFSQGNIKASRKQIGPLIHQFFA